jgi:hypothetical protein
MANDGPTPQADLLAIFKRLFAVARSLERRDRLRVRRLGSVDETGTAPRPRPVPVGRATESRDDA